MALVGLFGPRLSERFLFSPRHHIGVDTQPIIELFIPCSQGRRAIQISGEALVSRASSKPIYKPRNIGKESNRSSQTKRAFEISKNTSYVSVPSTPWGTSKLVPGDPVPTSPGPYGHDGTACSFSTMCSIRETKDEQSYFHDSPPGNSLFTIKALIFLIPILFLKILYIGIGL